jgi:hypothetical protein
MVVMAMRDGDGIHVVRPDFIEPRQASAALDLRVHSGVEQDAVIIQFHHPRAGADGGVRIQVQNVHPLIKP